MAHLKKNFILLGLIYTLNFRNMMSSKVGFIGTISFQLNLLTGWPIFNHGDGRLRDME